MDPTLFRRFCDIAYRKAGISLRHGKEALVSARVAKRLRALGIEDPLDYLSVLESDVTGEEIVFFLDAISTNHTSFFREPVHFTCLTNVLRTWVDAGQRRLRIWCAGCSSGEEPYTVAITTHEVIEGAGLDFKLLATDISTQVLEKATKGVYEARTVSPVPREYLTRYFQRLGVSRTGEPTFRVIDVIRDYVLFRRLNLAIPPFPMNGPLDVVFCRNVMIYFDQPVRQRLVTEIERLLRPGGYFIVGHAETLTGIDTGLVKAGPSLFRKKER